MTGIIIFWRGLWDIARGLPYLQNPYVSVLFGLLVLSLSGYIYYEDAFIRHGSHHFNTLKSSIERARGAKGWSLKYHDDAEDEEKTVNAKYLHKIERSTVILRKNGKESFIPLHRITQVRDGNNVVWKH